MSYLHNGKEAIIVFNGEIYNFMELKEELITKGYKFNSNSDTELILAGYLEWGEECVNKFNGMWAFCIYDKSEKKLFLSRDRLGKKPLYYFFNGKKFIFSSEIKGILAHNIPLKIDKKSIDFLLSIGFIPSPNSIYCEIKKLEPRTSITFDLKKKKIKKNRYFQIPKYAPKSNKDEQIRNIVNLLRDSVKKRLISDVPIGAFLSGGVDSSLVVSQMAEYMDIRKLNTFSIRFDGKFDESKYAEIMKKYLKTIHHSKYFSKKEFLETLPEIPKYYDEPLADISCYPSFFVSKMAKQYVSVVLSGDGGDEIFGGYPIHRAAYFIQLLRSIPKIILNFIKYIPNIKNIKKFIGLINKKDEDVFVGLLALNQHIPNDVEKWIKEKCSEIGGHNLDLAELAIRYDLYYATLADNFLMKVDRGSMAHGLEVRSPLLDYRYLKIESEIPTRWKVGLKDTKILLKTATKSILPKIILRRRKQGFIPPMIEWIEESPVKEKFEKSYKILIRDGILTKEWQNILERDKNKILKMRIFMLGEWYSYWKNNCRINLPFS